MLAQLLALIGCSSGPPAEQVRLEAHSIRSSLGQLKFADPRGLDADRALQDVAIHLGLVSEIDIQIAPDASSELAVRLVDRFLGDPNVKVQEYAHRQTLLVNHRTAYSDAPSCWVALYDPEAQLMFVVPASPSSSGSAPRLFGDPETLVRSTTGGCTTALEEVQRTLDLLPKSCGSLVLVASPDSPWSTFKRAVDTFPSSPWLPGLPDALDGPQVSGTSGPHCATEEQCRGAVDPRTLQDLPFLSHP